MFHGWLSRRVRLLLWAFFVFATLHACGQCIATDRPNIIILLADDLGYGELRCQGNPQIPTPHIDSIAANGVRFTDGYVAGPNCSPSRAGLLTGRIPTRFGYEFNPTGALNERPGFGLPAAEVTIAETLQNSGYTTGLIGKWHQGGTADYHPLRHGFDEFFGFTHEGHYFVPPPHEGVTTMLRRKTLPGGLTGRWVGNKGLIYTDHMGGNEPDYDANNPIIRGGQPVAETEYLTDALTREAVDFIDRHDDKPFFLYLAYNAVHSPLQGADAYMKRFSHIKDIHRRIFAAMLANMDDSVGAVLKQLRASGLEENTIVFFLSDNGGPTRELTSSNLPLRGSKGQMYEGGLRVPFMMQWKGTVPSGQIYEKPVSSFDIYATAAANSEGVTAPKQVEGVDLIPFVTGKDSGIPHETLFWRQGGKTAIRHGDWKLVRMGGQKSAGKAKWELYDLAKDIAEETNLAESNPERLTELVKLWEKLNGEMVEPLF
ncbi:sulfatase [Novipirellula rosea]|uniref:sulfatase n=1 Tax=Novipirellula rosea TaxID=1031540 RepID=UPI0031E536C2